MGLWHPRSAVRRLAAGACGRPTNPVHASTGAPRKRRLRPARPEDQRRPARGRKHRAVEFLPAAPRFHQGDQLAHGAARHRAVAGEDYGEVVRADPGAVVLPRRAGQYADSGAAAGAGGRCQGRLPGQDGRGTDRLDRRAQGSDGHQRLHPRDASVRREPGGPGSFPLQDRAVRADGARGEGARGDQRGRHHPSLQVREDDAQSDRRPRQHRPAQQSALFTDPGDGEFRRAHQALQQALLHEPAV